MAAAALAGPLASQTPAPGPVQQTTPPAPAAPAPLESQPHGQVVIQSHGEPPARSPDAHPGQAESTPVAPDENARVDVSDAERSALTVTRYDLDLRLSRAGGKLEARARITVRNDSSAPLRQLPLQISSSLRWESATLLEGPRRLPLPLAQHRLDTDADHTGAASEAVLSLPAPLAAGATASLDLFYAGTVVENGDRLARLGAGAQQQLQADWDGVSPEWTGLRGFGNVLWYPTASPQLFLAEGNSLFLAVARMRQREAEARMRLRLSVDDDGDPPAAAYFCGRRQTLKATVDDPGTNSQTVGGLATADFPEAPLGFRLPSLFVVQQPEVLIGGGDPAAAADPSTPAPVVSSSNPGVAGSDPVLHPRPAPPATETADIAPASEPFIALVSSDPGVAAGLGSAGDRAAALLRSWLGARPLSALTVLDHPGQPFQDGPLLVAPAAELETSPERPALTYSLTHAWVQTGQPWMDEGLAQFFALLAVEQEAGRAAALQQLKELLQPVALAEPDLSSATDVSKAGQPLLTAQDELFYRRKAAAVWWMLRDLAGEAPLRAALTAWRTQPEDATHPEVQAVAFEHLLERLSGKDLHWFFADWVLQDRGLPDLAISDVQVSSTPAGPGHNSGFLVAVTVRNAGGATADVPLVVQSAQGSTADRIRVPGFSQVTQRVLVPTPPTTVVVNDGSTPELTQSTHSRTIAVHTTPE